MRRFVSVALVVACKGGHETATTTNAPSATSVVAQASATASASASSIVASPVTEDAFADDPSARGRAEHGYALLREGKLEEAAGVLEEARTVANTPLLFSQVEFNIGLVEEKRGNAEHARAAFARAYASHASDVAKGKLAGRSMCAASIDRTPMVLGPSVAANDYLLSSSWREVHAFAASRGTNLLPTIHDWTIHPTSDVDARKLLCTDTSNPDAGASLCASAPPWAIDLGHLMFREGYVHVLPVSATRVLVVDGGMDGGGCTGMGARPASSTGVSAHGNVLVVSVTVEWWNDATCKTGKVIRTDHHTTFYDAATLRITSIDAAATLAGRTLTVDAKSCDPVSLDP